MPLDPNSNYAEWAKHGNDLAEPKLQDGAVITYDGYGLMVFSGTYLVADNTSADNLSVQGIPDYGQEAIRGSGLYVSKKTQRYNADGTLSIDIEAIGIEKAYNGATTVAVEGMSTCSSEPIETHPNFAKLAGTATMPLNGAVFDKDGKFSGFAASAGKSDSGQSLSNQSGGSTLAGVKSYLSPKVTYRCYLHIENTALSGIMRLVLFMVGKTTVDGVMGGFTLLPAYLADTNQSYLLTSFTPENLVVDKRGEPKILKLTFEFMAASVKWNEDIYETMHR